MAEPQPPAAAGEAAGDGAAGSAAAAAAEAAGAAAEGAGGGGEEDGFIDAGDVTYTPYRPAKVRIGKPHPDPVVENTSLAAVPPPDVTYESHLPPSSLEQLSEVQMESVMYAGQQFSKPHLKNGERAGFMIGDGAGVGKGRQLAGIIMDAWMQGHKRHIWFSISPDLLHDTKRDLKDIKPGKKNRPKVYNLSDLAYDDNLSVGDGVIFCTYKSLTLGHGTVARLGQLTRWLGGRDAEGCIVFDEAHKAKNLYLASKPTLTGKKVKEIQDRCPNARVVYCSATPCSEPMNMGYMTRLGLWGDGTRFEDFPDFLKDIDERGVGAMELVAMQLKAEGMLLSRSLSFQGCEFSLVPLVNSKFQIDSYNAAVKTWQLLWQVLNDAVGEDTLYTLVEPASEEEKAEKVLKIARMLAGIQGERSLEDDDPSECNGGKAKELANVGGIVIKPMTFGMMKSMYWAAHQRFFRAMCIAFKVEKAVEITKKALEDDMCVVIGLQSTGESNMRDAVKRKDAKVGENKFLSSPGEIIKRFIIKVFWADEEDDISDDDEWSLEPSKKRAKTEDNDGLSPLDWKPPKPLARGGATKEAETLEHSPDHEEKTGDDAAVAVDGIETPPLVPAPAHQVVDVEEIDVDEEEWAAAGGGGGGGSCGGGGGGGGGGSGGGVGGGETASPDPTIPSFTEEEDTLLWGQGETKFDLAKSRLHAWLDRIHYMVLPHPPLDQLVDKLGGPNAVAEMTGRQDRMVKADDGKVYLEKRDANNTAGIDEQNNFERAEFNEGRKLVAIISDAASAGVSLHANRTRPENPRRRLHITLELPWSADKAIQQLGRTHRANQFQPPIYQLIVSEVCGETRFSAAVAKRLESLGALTQGDRRASHAGAGELGFTAFNVDNQYGKMSLDHIYRLCISSGEKPVVQPPDLADEECAHIRDEVIESRKDNERNNNYTSLSETSGKMRRKRLQKMRQLEDGDVTFFEAVLVWLGKVGIVVEDDEVNGRIHQNVQGNVSRFLNRILGLRIVRQHVLFDYFHSVLEYHVKEAKRDGTYEDGIRSLTGASCSVSVMRALDLPEETGLAKGEVEAVKVTIDKSMTFQQILPKYHFAKEETDRRIELAKKMQAERVAAGNKVNQRQIFSKTGFWTKRSGTEVYLVVDYPGRVTSGYSTYGVKRPVTVWSPCRGRVEISYKAFLNHHFVSSTEAEASHLWDVEMIRDKQDTDVFVLRGSRLLMAWPHLDKAFSFLYGGPSAETKKKDKTVRSPVVHVKAAAPSDPLEEAFAAAAAETLKEFNASGSEEDCGTALVSREDAGKSFIALQLPTTRSINEHMANQIFDVLERGTASNLRYDAGPLSRLR